MKSVGLIVISDIQYLFKEWAIHTGKHREGIDEPNFAQCKTRLRCALNKAPDIQERKDLENHDRPDPYKVYQFKDMNAGKSFEMITFKFNIINLVCLIRLTHNDNSYMLKLRFRLRPSFLSFLTRELHLKISRVDAA